MNDAGDDGGQGDAGSDAGTVVPLPITWQLGVGANHACALNADGGVLCWGDNLWNQIQPNGGPGPFSPTSLNQLLPPATALRVGGNRECVDSPSAGFWCFGNPHNSLDGGTPDGGVRLLWMGGYSSEYGEDFSCLIGAGDGRVQCWGRNDHQQCGVSTGTFPATLTDVGVAPASSLSLSSYDACAVLTDGGIWCWGDNQARQLVSSASAFIAPTPVNGVPAAIAVASGASHTCALLADEQVSCWGYDGHGELGRPDDGGRAPEVISGLGAVVQLAAGNSHTCALLADAGVRCWGDATRFQTGTDAGGWQPVEPVGLPIGAVDVQAGERHTCALLLNDEIWCWGAGDAINGCGVSCLPLKVLGP